MASGAESTIESVADSRKRRDSRAKILVDQE